MDKEASNRIEKLLLGVNLSLIVSLHVTLIMQTVFLLRNLAESNWNFYRLFFFDINVALSLLVLEIAIWVSLFAIYKEKFSRNYNF